MADHEEGHEQRVREYLRRHRSWVAVHDRHRAEGQWLNAQLLRMMDQDCNCVLCLLVRKEVWGETLRG
jgi:hypothetical protein